MNHRRTERGEGCTHPHLFFASNVGLSAPPGVGGRGRGVQTLDKQGGCQCAQSSTPAFSCQLTPSATDKPMPTCKPYTVAYRDRSGGRRLDTVLLLQFGKDRRLVPHKPVTFLSGNLCQLCLELLLEMREHLIQLLYRLYTPTPSLCRRLTVLTAKIFYFTAMQFHDSVHEFTFAPLIFMT